jgi:hypothetical protein
MNFFLKTPFRSIKNQPVRDNRPFTTPVIFVKKGTVFYQPKWGFEEEIHALVQRVNYRQLPFACGKED